MTRSWLYGLALATLAFSCAAPPKADPRYPPREPGCAVQIFKMGLPDAVKADELGRVEVTCSDLIAPSDCLRELQDQSCKLGGDIVYAVPEEPFKPASDKVRYTGHAAHTHLDAKPAASAGKAK